MSAKQIGIAIVEHEGRFLIGIRGPEGPLPGKAEFPGGKCHAGEEPAECVVRECLEETGLAVLPVELLQRTEFVYPHATVDLHFWLCRPRSPSDVEDQHADFRWMPADALAMLDFPDANAAVVRALLQRFGSGPHRSETMSSRNELTTGDAVRQACRDGRLDGQTSGLAAGFAQANLVILPREHAFDFLLFCRRNPKPCPLLDVTEPGDPIPRNVAPNGDLRTDLPKYRVWKHGELTDEPTEITDLWRPDFVSFVIGCSFTFEAALLRAGVPVRHIDLGRNVPMFRTSIPCRPAGVFHGPLVVSMRPMTPADAIRAVQITSRYPDVHGAPVHLGMPERIGISDLSKPDFGDPVPLHDGEIPVFWACGVTPQAALMAARLPFAITHSPGCMFVTDRRDDELAVG